MDDSKLKNVGTSITNIKNDLLSLTSVMQTQVLPAFNTLVKSADAISNSINGAVGGKGKKNSSKNSVADNGVMDGGDAGGPTDNSVADNGAGNGGFAKSVGGMYVAAGAARAIGNALPGVSTSVMQDFLTQRSAFYGIGGGNTGVVNSMQKQLAKQGTALNSMDSTNALIMAQSTGLTGVGNLNQVMQGAAQASNFTPGLGLTAATQAIGGTMNAPTTVNLARTIGINIRQADGSMMPFPQMVDKLWAFISQNSGGKGMDKKSLQYSMQPGYGVYNMISGLFNGDPVMIKMVQDALLVKATFSGQALSSISKDQMVGAHIQSATVRAIGNQTAAQTGLLVSTASATSGGYAGAADVGAGMNNLAAAMSDLTAVMGGGKGLLSGLGGLGNGTIGTIGKAGLSLGASSLIKSGLSAVEKSLPSILEKALPLLLMGFLADGGPADGGAPYIVGERGPELFVPKSDGVVVPNHLLGNSHRKDGGPVKAPTEIYNFLTKSGLSPSGATGVIGNLVQESNLNTKALGDGGTSYGIAQWHNSRWNSLNAFSKKLGLDPSSMEAQQQFLLHEIKNNPSLYKNLSSKSITEGNAASLFMRDFERPADTSAAAATKRALLGTRAIQGKWDPTVTTQSGAAPATTAKAVNSDPTAAGRLASLMAETAAIAGNTTAGMSGVASNAYNYNYGGITITVNGAKDPNATGAAVAKHVKDLAKK